MASPGDRCPVSYIYDFNGIATSNTTSPLLSATLPSSNAEIPLSESVTSGVSDENYCLRWNDYEKKYAETFRVLRDDEFFTDVTITTEGYSVKAHRVILSACSSYFHLILKSMSPWQHPVLVLQDVRTSDLNSLMDFIYFGQVNINQDSLSSFLKVAERLKIKGLCDSLSPTMTHTMAPPPLHVPHSHRTLLNLPTVATLVTAPNFDNILPTRNAYIQHPLQLQSDVSQATTLNTASSTSPRSSAPMAHQSPKHSAVRSLPTIRSIPDPLLFISPKRSKYHAGTTMALPSTTIAISAQSLLRSQLQQIQQHAKGSGLDTGETSGDIQVKAEPMTILTTTATEESPSVAAANVGVAEYITADGELAGLPSLGQQFMFSTEGLDSVVTAATSVHTNPSAIGMDDKTVIAISVSDDQHQGGLASIASLARAGMLDEPQDLTPVAHEIVHAATGVGMVTSTPNDTTSSIVQTSSCGTMIVVGTGGGGSPSSSPTPTKKDRNARRNCPYCNKDFHEMSLKRHVKDVHFRSKNTYVICPHCCRQYASQNSLYSHLNRVHGIKKDMLGDMHLQLVAVPSNSDVSMPGTSDATDGHHINHHQHRDRIMDLAHNSDVSMVGANEAIDSHHINHQQQRDRIMDLAHNSDSSN